VKGIAMSYVFDRDFDAEGAKDDAGAAPADGPLYTDADLRAAERTARAEGFEAGRQRGRAEAAEEARTARCEERHDALLALAAGVERLCADAAAHRAALEAQMIDFALVTCERVMPEILRTRSTDRAAAEVRRCLGLVMESPRIRIFLSRPALEEHRAAIEQTIRDRHAGAEVELAADPALDDGDARVEWDDGVMEYSFGQIADMLLEALRRMRPVPAETTAEGKVANG
jgi:flagellar assembly protein FliH